MDFHQDGIVLDVTPYPPSNNQVDEIEKHYDKVGNLRSNVLEIAARERCASTANYHTTFLEKWSLGLKVSGRSSIKIWELLTEANKAPAPSIITSTEPFGMALMGSTFV
jgi:hypothetical protein